MAATNFTPISLYYSTTASAVPTSGNLVAGELALNTLDEKLYFKNSAGTVKLLASNAASTGTVSSVAVSGGTTGLTTSGGPITTSGTITLAGTLATTNGGTNLTSFTSGGAVYATSTSALTTGTLPIASGGTGQTTANAAFNALVPSQTSQSGKYLTTDGTNTSWGTNPLGTVTSVAATVPSFLSITGSPITTSGTLAISLSGTALPTTSGGTGLTSFTSGGVVYASSTSALATGSALTFNGTQLNATASANSAVWMATINSNAGASADNQFIASNGANNAIMSMKGTGFTTSGIFSASNAFFGGTGTSSTNLFSTNGNVNIFPASTLVATFTTTGLGIGTSSPAVKLDIRGTTGASSTVRIGSDSNDSGTIQFFNTTGSTTNASIAGNLEGGNAGGNLTFSTKPLAGSLTERLRIDSAGNAGLGVTPSAWADFKSLQVSTGSLNSTSANNVVLASNAYWNGTNWKYISSSSVTWYQQSSGAHSWNIAASGTAGNNVSYTQAMTLDASGRLGITTTSPSYPLDIGTSQSAETIARVLNSSTNASAAALFRVDNNTSVLDVGIRSTGASAFGALDAGSAYLAYNGSTSLVLFASNASSVIKFACGGTAERARIDAAGNVLVGGTAARGTTVGTAHLDLFNGTAPVGTLTNGVSLYSASGDLKFMDAAGNAYTVGFRNVPQSGSSKTSSYTLATTDVGEYILLGASGAIVIPDATFAAGDVITIFNNTASTATLTCSITTAYIAGTFTDKATMTLAAAGVATVLFITSTLCVVTGNVT
jgi:hypothetical protein